MESDNSQIPDHGDKAALNTTTHSHQDIDHETQHKRTLGGENERESFSRRSSGQHEANMTGALGVSSGAGEGAEEQPERVNSPRTVDQTQKDASTSDASPMFKPLLNSVLHSALESPAKKPIKEPLFRPSPPSDEEEAASPLTDVISLHSTDSEAASDEDAIVVEGMVSSYGSLFTPPASSDDDTPLSHIRSLRRKPKKPPRYVMSHVEVPPLRRPKSDYKDCKDIFPPKPPRKKKTVQVQSHSSLLAALQSQMTHNSEIHDEEDMIVEKIPKKKRKSVQQNAVAGPSRLPPSSGPPRSKAKPKRRFVESSSSSDEFVVGGSSRAGPAPKRKILEAERKRQKMTIDLTLDEDDEGTPTLSPPRRPSPRRSTAPQTTRQKSPSVNIRSSPIAGPSANRSSPIGSPAPSLPFRRPSFDASRSSTPEHEGHQRLNLRFYQYPPPSILHVNTQFHRQWFQDNAQNDSLISSPIQSSTPGNGEADTSSAVYASRFPWGGLLGGCPSRQYLARDDSGDVVSLGYASLGFEEDDDVDFEDEDADADVPLLSLERQSSVSSVVEETVRLVRIDLAAELKKRKLAKGKQKQKQTSQISIPATPRNDPLKTLLVLSPGGISPTSGSGPLGPVYPATGVLQPHPPPPSTDPQQSDDFQTYLTPCLPSSATVLGMDSPAGTLPYAIRRPLGNLGVFMHDYAARPPSPDAHLQIAPGSPPTAASSLASFSTAVGADAGTDPYPHLYSLALQQGPSGAAMSTATMPHFHQSDEILLAATGAGAGQRLEADAMFPSGAVFDGGLAALHESWMTAGQQYTADYGYDTVDPTLICGGFANHHDHDGDAQVAGASGQGSRKIGGADGECTRSDDDRDEASIVSMLSNPSKAGSLFSGQSGTPSIKFQSPSSNSSSSSSSPTSSIAPLPTSLTSLDGSPSSESSGFSVSKPIRLETPVSASTPPVLLPSASNSYSKTLSAVGEDPSRELVARCESSPLSDLTSLSDGSLAAPATTESKLVPFPNVSQLEVVITQKPQDPARGWEEDTADEDVYCHQCRTRNGYPKTRCACKAKYCARCVRVRPKYAQMLEPGGRVYSCPRCEQWCTCSTCCRKRGETYVPVKGRITRTSHLPTVIPCVDDAIPRPLSALLPPSRSSRVRKILPSYSPPPSPQPHADKASSLTSVSQPSFFIGPGPSSQSVSEPPAPPPKKKSRVFIGKAQQSWGLGKKPRTRELNPAPRAVWPENPTGPCTVRYYIGSADFLQHRPLRLESTDDLLAGVTSVASLEESDTDIADDAASTAEEVTLVNDDKSDLSSSALCRRDVARAISATYESLGHTVILSEELDQ